MEPTGFPQSGGGTEKFCPLAPDRAYISIIESSGQPIVKTFLFNNGIIEKHHGAQIGRGRAITIEANTAADLKKIINSLSKRQAIALGVRECANRWEQIFSRINAGPGQITRSKEHFTFATGAGWCLFDIDTGDFPESFSLPDDKSDWWGVIKDIVPELKGLEHLVVPSSSAGVYAPNGIHNTANSLHVYVRLTDAGSCPALVDTVYERLWEAGYGFVKIGRDGKQHLRTLVDRSVASPERLIFEACPIVRPPLLRRAPPVKEFSGPSLQSVEKANKDSVATMQAAAKSERQPEAEQKRSAYIDAEATKVSKETGISKAAARKRIIKRISNHVLLDEDMIETLPGQLERVGDLLDRMSGAIGMPCPIEGSEYGSSTAYFYPADGYSPVPRIVSFAHGDKTFFRFQRYKQLWGLQWLDSGDKELPRTASSVQIALKSLVNAELMNVVLPEMRKPKDEVPELLFRASVGVGKSSVIDTVLQGPLSIGARILIRVPTIELAEERRSKLEEMYGPIVGVWRGLNQPDPEREGHAMCLKAETVSAAKALGADLSSLCGTKKKGWCPHHPEHGGPVCCGYRQQNLRGASIVIMAGDQALQRPLPSGCKKSKKWQPTMLPKPKWRQLDLFAGNKGHVEEQVLPLSNRHFDLVIIDETDPSAWVDGGEEHQLHDLSVMRSRLAAFPVSAEQERIIAFLEKFVCLASQSSLPYPAREFLGKVGSENELILVSQAAYALIPEPPDAATLRRLSAREIRTRYAELQALRSDLLHVSRMANALLRAISQGWAFCRHIEFHPTEAGTFRVSVQRRLWIRSGLDTVAKLIFDATAQPDLLKGIFPNLKQVCHLKAMDGAAVLRFQLRDRTISMTNLRTNPTWPGRVLLLSTVLERALGRTGCISIKDLIEKIVANLAPDDQLEVGHFGAVKGINRFEDCAALIICGRIAITPKTAERMAAVLMERDIPPLGCERFPKTKQQLEGRKANTGWIVSADKHPDPLVDAARASVSEDQLEQARGRGRNTRRTPQRPLTEYILTQLPTQFPVDGTFTAAELYAATSWPTLLLTSGIWLSGGSSTAILGILLKACLLRAQTRECLYMSLIGNPAFESPERASKWRKDQLADNPELMHFVEQADKKFSARADTLDILYAPFPISDFQPVRAKVLGARYFAQLYIVTGSGQKPQAALYSFLGSLSGEVEIEEN